MKQTTLILILLLCSLNGYSKNVNTEKITRISDSILLSKTDEILFRYFKISDGSFYRYLKNNDTRIEKFLSKSKIKSDNITEIWVLYSFDFPEIDGINNGVWIKLDKNLNLIENVDLSFIPEFLWNRKPCNFLSVQKAFKKGIEFFKMDGFKIEEPELYYDEKLKIYVYRITNYLTKSKNLLEKECGETEVIVINAFSGELVKRENGIYGIVIR